MTTEIFPCTGKVCKKCGIHKPLSDFYQKNSSVDGHEHSCKTCRRRQMSAADKARYESARRREAHLMNAYVITPAIYDHLLLMQGGHCAMCPSTNSGRKGDKYLVVDHCHTTNQIRGLLCHNCNILLGAAKDDQQTLQNAISYLSKYA
jgi:hypothetical protein